MNQRNYLEDMDEQVYNNFMKTMSQVNQEFIPND
jgi:hypothetical protein